MVDQNARYLLCSIQDTNLAIPASQILHIGDVPYITRVPLTPPSMRGVINLRGNVIPIIDLRLFFSMRSLQQEVDEFSDTLDQRMKEHEEWVDELLLSITSDKIFSKVKNHHDCAFGKWYYQFKTSNKSMEMLVKRFREPHKKIHELADLAHNLKVENRQNDAVKLINDAKSTTLKQLFNVFDLVKAQYAETNRALAVIVKTGDYRVGFLVDTVHSVERFNESQRDSMEESEFHSAISSYADSLYKKDENIYYSLIPEKIIMEAMAVELQEA